VSRSGSREQLATKKEAHGDSIPLNDARCEISGYPHGDSNPGLLAENQKEQHRKLLASQQDTKSQASACTTACTKDGESEHGSTIEALAAAVARLSPGDRDRLAALLLGQAHMPEKGEADRD
jgi:hypothetical protein